MKKQLTKKTLMIAGLAAVSISIIYLLATNQLVANKPVGDQKEHIIKFNEEGFRPEELSINTGETVTFVGDIDRAFWPASNLHPSHGEYPEFDPREPIAPYGSWSFKFNNAGTWKYHDHLAPYFTGVINVQDGQVKNNTITACEKDPSSSKCSQELILSTLEEKGLEPALELLAEEYKQNPEIPPLCHNITHDLGIAAYKNFLKDNDSVLTPKAAFCANGFYHGFMEALLTASRDPQRAKEFCYYIDEKIGDKAPDAALQCHHGIGHGAMDIAILDAKAKNEKTLIDPALKLCEKSSDTPSQLYRCTSGIFNGIANFYITGEYGLSINKKNPTWVCDEQIEKYKESCYGNMNSLILWTSGNNFPTAMKLIENMEDDTYAIPSTRYLAGLATLSFAKSNPNQAITACREIRENLREACIEGFAHGFLEHGTPESEYIDAFNFCETQMMSGNERNTCFKYVLSNIHGWYAKDKAIQICENAEADYKHHCNIL